MTKRIIFTSLLCLIMTGQIIAHELTPSEALSLAMEQIHAGKTLSRQSKAVRGHMLDMVLTYTGKSINSTPLYYVFEMPEGGFLMAGADSRANALLGYCDEGSFDASRKNPAFEGWLANCTEALQWLSTRPETTVPHTRKAETITTPVAPLLGSIKWDQDNPYNLMCPTLTDEYGESVLAPTGCVATATAQVMMYHKWPLTGEGENTNLNLPEQTVDFSQSVYDWDNVLETYTGFESESDVHAQAVAKLMADVGCAENMNYGVDASGTSSFYVFTALSNHFRYDKSMRFVQRHFFSTDDWNAMLRNELDNARPIIFGGESSYGDGHEFVLDGYDTNGLYHVNWGWSGMSDGYFDINYMDPDHQGIGGSLGGFNIRQDCVINVKPDKEGSSVGHVDMALSEELTFDPETGTFIYDAINNGNMDFTGEVGILLYDNEGNVVDRKAYDYADEKAIVPYDYCDYVEYVIPEEIKVEVGYRVEPYYSLTAGGEALKLEASVGCATYLEYCEVDGEMTWVCPADLLPVLSCSDITEICAVQGFAPKYRLTVTNDESSKVEYNDIIAIFIYDQEYNGMCYGYTPVFLKPGESKTIEVSCVLDYDYSYTDLEVGTYNREVYYIQSETYHPLSDSEEIEIEASIPSDITYSDFALSHTEIAKGEILTASFTATNAGGYDYGDYLVFIYNEGGGNSIGYFETYSDIPANSTTKVEIKGMVDLEPGRYFVNFSRWANDMNNYIYNNWIYFTVTDNDTAIKDANVDSRTDAIYDLQGRRVTEMKKGGVYIVNGRKVVK